MANVISDEAHRLRGTRPTRAKAPEGSKYRAGRPKMPKHLTAVAAEEWKRVVKLLGKRGTLTAADAPALEQYCVQYARWRALLAEIDQHGVMVEDTFLTKSGEPITRRVQNPAVKLAAQIETSMRQMLKEFSATPASREDTTPAAPDPAKQAPTPGTAAAAHPEWFKK